MPKIEIDGIPIDAEQGATIIEVADRVNIHIPRFCYHHKLSVAANCRMCLVQVEKSNKALPACATPITDGMKIWTKSKETVAAQRAVMEFLLINHPLDCPVCDQGGECELQDLSLEYGSDHSNYNQPKRSVVDENLGPLVATEMTRCIQCTRCVRFGSEVSGERELGATGRGETMAIGTFIEQTMNSEVSGNVIDLCPVGALTSKPFRFKARPWELTEKPSIAPHDCIGSNIYLHTLNQKVMRVVPRDNEQLNEVWLSDRDRFSYEGLLHEDRLRKPLIYKQDKWYTTTWGEAIKYAIAGLKLVVDTFTAEKLGVLVSPSVSTEEYFLLQKIVRGLGCNNIDHRLRQLDFSDQDNAPKYPNLGIKFDYLSKLDALLIIGSNVAKEQPLANIKIRKMVKAGGKVTVINPIDYNYNFHVSNKETVPAHDLIRAVAAIAKELQILTNFKISASTANILSQIKSNQIEKDIAAELIKAKTKHVLLGQLAVIHPMASQLNALTNLISEMLDCTYGNFSEGANAAGAWLSGCVPHRLPGGKSVQPAGKNAFEMLKTPLNAYILYGIEPEFDSILGSQAIETLRNADFVLAISAFQSDALLEIADVVLPLALFTEADGTFININGVQQRYSSVVPIFGESKPGWKILQMLGSLSGIAGFEDSDWLAIHATAYENIKLEEKLSKSQAANILPIHNQGNDLTRIAPVPLYATDSIVRRAKSLQLTQDAQQNRYIIINPKTAANLNVANGELVNVLAKESDSAVQLQVVIDPGVADFTALVYQNALTLGIGLPYDKLEVRKC